MVAAVWRLLSRLQQRARPPQWAPHRPTTPQPFKSLTRCRLDCWSIPGFSPATSLPHNFLLPTITCGKKAPLLPAAALAPNCTPAPASEEPAASEATVSLLLFTERDAATMCRP